MNKPTRAEGGKTWLRLVVLLGLVSVFSAIYYFFSDQLTLQELATRETSFRELKASNPWLVFGCAFLIYVIVAGFSIPGGATVLTLVLGWYLGFWPALLLVSFASTLGATIAFLMSRFLFREALMRKFGSRLSTFNQRLSQEGAFYLFTLRLIPAFPFWVINLVMGLTLLRTWTYWWVSQLGMLPGTAVYVLAGASVPDLKTLAEDGPGDVWPMITAFAILGIFPLIAKWLLKYFRQERNLAPDSGEESD